jgi:O-antigen/teichoic acid export membrane protein
MLAISDTTSGAIGSIFWLYLASFLAVSDYGEVQLLIGIAGLALGVSMIANNNTIIVYEVKQRGLRGTLFLFSLIIAAVVSVILFILYSRLDIILLTFGMICGEVLLAYFVGKKLFSKYGMFLILQKVLMVLFAVGLYFWIGLEGIIYGIGISYLPLIVMSLDILKKSSFNFSLLKENFGFIFNNYAVRLVALSRRNLDKILIVPILGFEILGEFTLAFQVYLLMNLFASMTFKVLLVNDSAGRNSNKFKVVILLISIIISVFGITLGPEIIPILFPKFINSIEIIPILSLAVIPNTIILIFSSKFLGNEKSRFIIIGTLIHAISYLLLVVLLGSEYGLLGISIGFLTSSIIYACYLVTMYKIQKEKIS